MVNNHHNKTMCCKAKMKCHKKMTDKPGNNCDGSSCINCPLGNLFTSQSINNTGIVTLQFKKEFLPLKTDVVSGVYWKVWRPPSVS